MGRHQEAREGRGRAGRRGRVPRVEVLEGRALLAGGGTGYVLSGQQWPNPGLITFSIPADGTAWDGGTDGLNAAMNAKFQGDSWKRELARALQTWAAAANLNIAQVPDANLPFDNPGRSQGDARVGDIRVGGYAYSNTTTLAQTYFPPPGGLTAAGDSTINTAIDWQAGRDVDLYSVMLHEFGHSLGLEHSPDPAQVMYAIYQGVRPGLSAGDLAGIQALYGPRTFDAFQAAGSGRSPAAPIDLTGSLGASHRAELDGVSLATIGDTEYFSVVAPALAGASLQVTAATAGVSLLSPRVQIFDAAGRLLDSEGNPAAWGDDVTATAAGVTANQRYLVAVTGATSDVFAVGAYHLQVAFVGGTPIAPPTAPPVIPVPPSPAPTPTAPSPVAALPPVVTPTPPVAPAPAAQPVGPVAQPVVPPDRLEPNNASGAATFLGLVARTTVPGLTLDSAADLDDFAFQATTAGTVQVVAPGALVQVFDVSGRAVAQGLGAASFAAGRAGAGYYVQISSASGAALPGYDLAIAVQPTPTRGVPRGPRRALPAARPRIASVGRHPVLSRPGGAPAAGRHPVLARLGGFWRHA